MWGADCACVRVGPGGRSILMAALCCSICPVPAADRLLPLSPIPSGCVFVCSTQIPGWVLNSAQGEAGPSSWGTGWRCSPYPLLHVLCRSRWVTEYADSYSIFLKRLDWSSPIFGQWLPFGKDARWTPRWREPAH